MRRKTTKIIRSVNQI